MVQAPLETLYKVRRCVGKGLGKGRHAGPPYFTSWVESLRGFISYGERD